jgi:mRNA-degrading endonuclease RelE of RelBE toxin-antitoxin system
MTWAHTRRSEKDYRSAPPAIQKAFDKQVRLLAKNLSHPSLHAKKYDAAADLWQARVNRDWRFYFLIQDDTCFIVAIIPHPK